MLHITHHGLEDDPCSTDGCEEGPWNRAERVEVATVDNPAKQIDEDSSEGRLYEQRVQQ